MLLDCYLLLDAAVGGADDIDTGSRSVGIGGLTRLDGEVGDGESTYVINTHIGLLSERGSDADGTIVNREYEVALTKVVT